MIKGTGSIYLALSMVMLVTACGSTSVGLPDGSNAGAGGTPAGAAGTTNAVGGAAAGGTNAAGSASGGTSAAGHTATGGQNAAAGHAGTGGNATVGGQGGSGGNATAGAANKGGAPSTDGLPFAGSCLDAVHCTDEWDTTFGAATLQGICVAQEGTWSSGHCAEAPWKKKCTQSVFGGVYVQYLPADGICAAGFEEAL
jgi:hypothetical protein